jgi:signal transduction histidine kinase
MRFTLALLTMILLFALPHGIWAQDTIRYSDNSGNILVGNRVAILEDKTNALTVEQALQSKDFVASKADVPNLQISASAFWVKIVVKNLSSSRNVVLNLDYPTMDSVTFFSFAPDGTYKKTQTGEFVSVGDREYKHQDYIFSLDLQPGESRMYLMRIVASEQVGLPLTIGVAKSIWEEITNKDLIFGLYAGIIMVMLLYNLFLYFTVRDRSYLYYVGYILFVGGTQACLQGYAPRFLYPNSYFLANAMMVWVPALSGIFSILFINNFMNIKQYTPGLYKLLGGIMVAYCVILAISLTGNYRICTIMMQLLVMVLSITGYTVAVKISRKGYRPAKFFLIAFSIFIIGVVIFVLRNANVLPYDNFTYYAMPIGSTIEVVLLSIALADKINIFRKEKEESQAQALLALQKNEQLVREQNVMLEKKVKERTSELQISNTELNKAMVELKEAESQLVESEKMASLGQLTAGIAHEINNPINFVTSNVKPLNRDVKILLDTVSSMEKIAYDAAPLEQKQKMVADLKADIDYDYLQEEIDQLLHGIGEGASRTAEIVKGLRIFSRLDEDDLKKADINEGLDSTLIITNNLLTNTVKVEKKYSNLPLVECYPGKLNQVFLNIITNGVHAIKKKFGDKDGGVLLITTKLEDGEISVGLADNGTGMDETTRKRIFEPFFTTKDVGEGTGLGLSIAYNTIVKHNGKIEVKSEVGKGTEFIIKLPLIHN